MGKIEAKKHLKREALFDAAYALFTTKGLNKTSISDIVESANLAKGTFYLYFKDKYDLCDKLIARKASQLFMNAYHSMDTEKATDLESLVLFITDHILNALSEDHALLEFVSKNLSWGVFRSLVNASADDSEEAEFLTFYNRVITDVSALYRNPNVMLYMILELINSSCYSPILYDLPVTLEDLRPDLHEAILSIIRSQRIQ